MSGALPRLLLRGVLTADRVRLAWLRARLGPALMLGTDVSPNLRLSEIRLEPEARLRIGDGFATERRPGNHLWVQAGGTLELGRRAWLRTEHGSNRLTVFPGARIAIGDDALVNGAMLHAKRAIEIGDECRLGFGARLLDSDLHPLDARTPERSEPIRIGDRVWIGADVIVLRGVSIGDDVVVAAGSVVTRDLPARCLALGSPARPVRDLERRDGC